MPLVIDRAEWEKLLPKAPATIIDAFVARADLLDRSGITATRTRLAYALANLEHECGGFTIPDLTENINYTAKRMAEVWPNRFKNAADVVALFGTKPGWQLRAFDHIYGNRMGNRPGTNDGSTYIGRGGPQITGRDGYKQVGLLIGINLVDQPDLASRPEHQPALLAGFVEWKGLNALADAGEFTAYVKRWNGGTNGMADRLDRLKGNDPIVSKLIKAVGKQSILDVLERILEEAGMKT